MIPKNENLFKYVENITSFMKFCIYLDGMESQECEMIEQEKRTIDNQKIAALAKWQSTGERTFKDLIRTLALIKQCADAKHFASEHNVYFDEEDVLQKCSDINEH